jgi:histidinol phosphatase-like PHP family hydrolase
MIKLTWNYHSHTNYTDGFHTIEDIAHYCDSHGVNELAVTEHVRKVITFNFEQLLSDIKRANDHFNVRILTGVEAKILPDGTLDCPDEIKKKVDIVIGSVHGLGVMTEQEAYEKLAGSDCMIVGHPQFFNEKMTASLVKTGKIIELSNRYAQSEEMIKAFKNAGLLFSIGLDSHRLEDFDDFGSLSEMIERLGLEERLWRFTIPR